MRDVHFWSDFLRISEQDGIVAVLHQLHPDPLFIRADVWTRIMHGVHDSTIAAELRNHGLIVAPGEDACVLEQVRLETLERLSRPTILYLMLAQGCNNACTYCPVPQLAARHGNVLLSLDDALAGIRLWRERVVGWNDGAPFFIILYGGEPLLNRPVLESVVTRVSDMKERGELPPSARMFVPTNGRLLDEQLAQFLATHDVLVAVGIDGTPREHNGLRITDQGVGTSQDVERAVGLLLDYGVECAVSLTLAPAVIASGMRSVAYLKRLGVNHIGSNLLKGVPLTLMLGNTDFETYARQAARFVLAASNVVDEYQVTKREEALVRCEPFSVDCTCSGNQIVVQSDGSLTNCPFYRVPVADIRTVDETFRISETDSVRMWRQRIPLLLDGGVCESVFLPSGGCAWGMFDATGSLRERDTVNEVFNEEVMHGILWRGLSDRERDRLLRGDISYWHHRRIGAV